jgi:hypothetical protein
MSENQLLHLNIFPIEKAFGSLLALNQNPPESPFSKGG